MNKLGDIKSGKEIGRKGTASWQKFLWHACIDCGKERWVGFIKGEPKRLRCHRCSNEINGCYRWKNHNLSNKYYTYVKLRPDDFFYPMVKSGKNNPKGGMVKEHRLVMAKSLGRCLESQKGASIE